MNEITFPIQSTKTLIKASIIALVIATAVFITIILPAEYNIDPTGSGQYLGLTALSGEVATEVAKPEEKQSSAGYQEHSATVVVPAYKGVEYKFKIQKHSNIIYQWSTDGAPLYFDFHGEPEGDKTGYFESYTIATAAEMKGSMTVPFDGVHGWYWKNTSDKAVTVTLKTQGNYEVVGLIH